MTPDQFAQDWDRSLAFLISKGEEALAAMTDDSQPDVQPGDGSFPQWGILPGADPNAQGIQSDAGPTQPGGWWSFDPLAGSDSQPDVRPGYVWAPSPEQAAAAERERVWKLVEMYGRGS